MKSIMIPALAAAAFLGLAGCETATPYQPITAHNGAASGGFYDHQIEGNRFEVGFSGNSLTSRETVERYLLYRAAELTVNQGFDWFTTVQRDTERTSDLVAQPGLGYGGYGGYWGPRWGLYGRGGWRYGYGDGFWGPGAFDYTQVSQYNATAEILMGKGPKPANDRRAFEARAVLDHLGPGIQRPAGS